MRCSSVASSRRANSSSVMIGSIAPLYGAERTARATPVPSAIVPRVADAKAVEQALRSMINRIDGSSDNGDLPDRTLLCILPDVDAAFRSHFSGGRLTDLEQVAVDTEADVRITARSDDLIALIEGRLNIAFAFLMGKIRVDASREDLMLIKSLF